MNSPQPAAKSSRSRLPLILLAVALALGAALWIFRPDTAPQGNLSGASVGGPFSLIDETGAPVTNESFDGKWRLMYFGFTYCPDVCPTTLQALAAAQQQLGPKAEKLRVVFISLDPARDTPAQLNTYLGSEIFPKGIIGLTGTPEQVAAAAKAYRVYFKKNGEGADYLVDHSTAAYLMDPKGRFDRVIPFGVSPEEIARQISEAMR